MLTHEEDIKVKEAIVEGCECHMERLRESRNNLCLERFATEEDLRELNEQLLTIKTAIQERKKRIEAIDYELCKVSLEMSKCQEIRRDTEKVLQKLAVSQSLLIQEVAG